MAHSNDLSAAHPQTEDHTIEASDAEIIDEQPQPGQQPEHLSLELFRQQQQLALNTIRDACTSVEVAVAGAMSTLQESVGTILDNEPQPQVEDEAEIESDYREEPLQESAQPHQAVPHAPLQPGNLPHQESVQNALALMQEQLSKARALTEQATELYRQPQMPDQPQPPQHPPVAQ